MAMNVGLGLLVIAAGYFAFITITAKKAPKSKATKRAPKAAKTASKKAN